MSRGNIDDRFRGKWPSILKKIGIAETHLKNKHGPCPLCGGEDRFRFDDKSGRGTFYCNNCGAGTGLQLAQRFLGFDFKQTMERLEEYENEFDPGRVFDEPYDEAKRRRNLNDVWAKANRPEIARAYMTHRGISKSVLDDITTIRGTNKLWDSTTKREHPGVVSLIQDPKGRPVSLHRIYIGEGSRWKKIMPPVGTINGCAVRLGNPTDHLSVAEGIESGLAVRFSTKEPVWCGITAHGVETMELPDGLKQLSIYADRDDSFTGQKVAYTLAHRYFVKNKDCRIYVMLPTEFGTDPLDQLTGPEVRFSIDGRGS